MVAFPGSFAFRGLCARLSFGPCFFLCLSPCAFPFLGVSELRLPRRP